MWDESHGHSDLPKRFDLFDLAPRSGSLTCVLLSWYELVLAAKPKRMQVDTDVDALERQLRASRRMFDVTFHATPIGKALVDVSGHCREVNAAFARILGHEPDDVVGMHFADFTHPDDADADIDLFLSVMRGERDSYQIEKRYLDREGGTVHVLMSATVLRDDDGSPLHFIAEVLDITEPKQIRLALQEANARLNEQVVTDHLTGLRNRRGFEEALTRADGATSLLLIDLDNFKHVNDVLGHDAGDAVLAEVGRRLARQARPQDVAARTGGDEFGVILFDADRSVAERLASRIVQVLGVPYQLNGAFPPLGASVGVACAGPRQDVREMVSAADAALYAAKRAGRGQWRLGIQSGVIARAAPAGSLIDEG
jgi:diguanylate cyclase (GGDEF)-like protein/PAS domain S-box-containing protein